MKRQYFIWVLLFLSFFNANAQFTLNEGFESFPPANWIIVNNSNPLGTSSWFQGNVPRPFAPKVGAGYIAADLYNTSDSGTISNWLISPVLKIVNDATFTFYTRTATNVFPDRLEIRMSTNGNSSYVGNTETSVGDFTTKLCDINPIYATTGGSTCGGGYPSRWTQYSITISGVPSCADGRIAFRYFVENAGFQAENAEYIGIDSFNYSGNCVLPVSVINFTGTNEGKQIKLNWSTSSEFKSQQFDVLKSSNGIYFEKIGSVNAIGFSNTVTNYHLTDAHPIAGENYYQLKQIDESGSFKLSNIIMVRNASSSENFSAYILENPVGNECVIKYNNLNATKLEGSILDIYGRTIKRIVLSNLNTGAGRFEIPVSNLVSGNYIVKLTTSTHTNVILRLLKK